MSHAWPQRQLDALLTEGAIGYSARRGRVISTQFDIISKPMTARKRKILVVDDDPGIRPQAHQFVIYASPLEPIPDDGLPRFPERLGTTPPL